MARARNIKPAFFNNDELAEIEPIGRLLFIGLWTICDYKGNLEYRPKKIKASILPYDNCNVDKLSINLEQSGFIQSYSNNGITYINISNFTKHQNPHKNERDKGSDVPCITDNESQLFDLKGSRIKSEKIAINPDNNGTNPADSLILNPDSLSLIPDTLGELDKSNECLSRIFNHWVSSMNKNQRTQFTANRKKCVTARLKDGYSEQDIITAITSCAKSPYHMGQNDTGTIYDDLTLICRNGEKLEGFINNADRSPVKQQTKQQSISDNNREAMQAFLNQGDEHGYQ